MIGSGTMYATVQFIHNKNQPRFDFVTVSSVDGVELAQVLNFIELSNGATSKIYAYVAWLTQEDDKKDSKFNYKKGMASKYFDRYKYCTAFNYTSGAFKCRIDLIESSSIIGPAYVVPDFKDNDAFNDVKPSKHHRFFFVDRKWTDRSDWVESVMPGPPLPADVDDYIKRMAITRPGGEEAMMMQQQDARTRIRGRGRGVAAVFFDIDVDIDDVNAYEDDTDEDN
jgi:hypothetical protein